MYLSIKKLLIIISISAIMVLLFAVNQSINNTYDMSVFEYTQYSMPINEAELNYLKNKGTLYFVSDSNAPPFAYIDKNTGQYKGLVIDYVSALSIELEVDIEYVPQKWENVINSVVSGEADMCDVFPSEERMKHLIFSEPLYNLRAIVMTDRNSKLVDINDLSGHTVAIPSGDYAIEYLRDNIPNVSVIETADLLDSIKVFQAGKADAVIGDEPVLLNFINDLGINNDVMILESELYDREVSIGVNKSDAILVSILNKGILNLQKKNFVEKIQQRWFGISAPILKYKVPEKFMLLVIVLNTTLIVIFMIMALWSYTLKIEVMKRTDDLNKSRNNLQVTFDNLSSFLICLDDRGYIVNSNKLFSNFLLKDNIIGLDYKSIPLLSQININNSLKVGKEITFDGRFYLISTSELEHTDFKYLIVIEDITDKKISQQQILQQNKMIALGQLAAGVAHEIRNPIGLIQNYCYILKTYIFNNNPIAEESIEVIENSVQRVDKIVNNLLEFSHIGTNKPSLVKLRELIMNIISLENKTRIKNNIEIIVNCNDELKLYTKAESLNHIILNLLSNSMDSMDNGGIIRIDCKEEENFLIVNFSDNGTGISQENLERIFNPFFTTKKVGQGTGLGLYIVYNEIQKIGGEIQVESKLGHGTTFRLKFPMVKEMSENVCF